jgi:hypothetical protein
MLLSHTISLMNQKTHGGFPYRRNSLE